MSMIKKGTKLYSIIKSKCPHCQEGSFFEGSMFKGTPKQKCDVCQEPFSKEPGFYQGSYYVVYALGVAVFVTIWCSIELFIVDIGFRGDLISVIVGLILTAPFTYPLSKTIWANMFFHYNGHLKDENNELESGEGRVS